MYLSYEQVAISTVVKDVDDLTIPGNATHARIQANGTNAVRYTMDNVTSPTQTVGMFLPGNAAPQTFLIEDIRRIKFIRGAASDGALNLHYFGPREIT